MCIRDSNSPIRSGEALDMNPDDASRLGLATGDRAEVSSRRGTIEMSIRVQSDLPVGLCFTTYHFTDTTDTNILTIEAWDKESGTAEFKATAINVKPLVAAR